MRILAIVLSACLGDGPAAPSSPGLDPATILLSMQENEQLYKNLDLKYDYTGTLLLDPKRVTMRSSLTVKKHFHNVTQDELYRGKSREVHDLTDGSHQDFSNNTEYDGKLTRTNSQEAIGNISDVRVPTSAWLTPHRMAFQEIPQDFSVADWLGFRSPVRTTPAYKAFSVTLKVLGRETIDDIACIKLESIWMRAKSTVLATRYLVWVAPERNYVPVKTETYYPAYSDTIPGVTYKASDFREVAPGQWFPYTGELNQLWFDDLQKQIVTPYSRGETSIIQAKLDPAYPVESFSDIPMPEEGTTYIFKGGEIVDTKYPVKPLPKGSGFFRTGAIWLGALLALGSLVMWTYQRYAMTSVGRG